MRPARLTSATEQFPISGIRQRAGFTLVEAMIASVLLAASVLGVSGTILSSYAHDQQSIGQRDALRSASSLMDEITALPFVAASASSVGLMDFHGYSDTSTAGQATLATAKLAQTRGTPAASSDNTSSGGLVGHVVGLVGGLLGGSSSTPAPTPSPTAPVLAVVTDSMTAQTAARTVSITRHNVPNGADTAVGDLAIVTVDAVIGRQTVRVKRLVSSTEAASAAATAALD